LTRKARSARQPPREQGEDLEQKAGLSAAIYHRRSFTKNIKRINSSSVGVLRTGLRQPAEGNGKGGRAKNTGIKKRRLKKAKNAKVGTKKCDNYL